MKRFIYILLTLPFFSFAQIQINEFLADNDNCCLDDFGETEDFVIRTYADNALTSMKDKNENAESDSRDR